MNGIKLFTEGQKQFLSYPVLLFLFIVLLYRWYCHLLLSQLESPVLLYPQFDDFYWLFIFSGIAEFIVSHRFVAVMFDILFVIMPLVTLFFQKRIFYILLAIMFYIYMISFNLFLTHHAHAIAALFLIIIPFLFKNKHFTLLFWGVRYYLIFIFASAAFWKIWRGSVLHLQQMELTLKGQHIDYLLFKYGSFSYELILYLLNNPAVLNFLYFCGVALQVSFVIGFFTRKYDKILFFLLIVFLFFNLFIMRINFFELLILGITLLPWYRIFPKFGLK